MTEELHDKVGIAPTKSPPPQLQLSPTFETPLTKGPFSSLSVAPLTGFHYISQPHRPRINRPPRSGPFPSITNQPKTPAVGSRMAHGAASTDGLLRCVYEGCLAGCDGAVERRPYHRYCSCALHKSRSNFPCSHSRSLSYPIRKSWSENCLALMASSPSSSPSSPALHVSARSRLVHCNFEGQEDK